MGIMERDNNEEQDVSGASDIDRLYDSLEKEDIESAVSIINHIGDHKNLLALEPLVILLEYHDVAIRGNAALALGKIGDSAAVEPLILLLKDESDLVKESAATALGELGDERALKPLENMDISVINPKLTNAVRNAIYHLNNKKSGQDVYGHCDFCGKTEQVLHMCNYCGEVFCSEHQSRESHRCSPIQAAVSPANSIITIDSPVPAQQADEKRSKKNIVIIAASIFVILILLAGIGAVAYTLLFPPIWTEQLQFKNSTGQLQSMVMYRNATDVTYDNLTRFLSSSDIERQVQAEPDYKCVEFAVLLHDDAEIDGINGTIIGTEMSGDIPGHALDVFYTTDRGVVYVDTSSMNVSANDFGGIPYDKVILLRDTWVQDFPLINADDVRVTAQVYRNATPVSYDRLIQFIGQDDTADTTYSLPDYTCGDFAAHLFNDSQAAGIKSGIVSVGFQGNVTGHAFNVFPTTDKGLVYIDCTGINQSLKQMGYLPSRNIVYLQVGKVLGEIPDNQTGGNLDYSYYDDRSQRMVDYRAKWQAYKVDLNQYSQDKAEYEGHYDSYTSDLNAYNNDVSNYNVAQNQYKANPTEDQRNSLNAWYDRLTSTKNSLISRQSSLQQEKNSLDTEYNGLKSTYDTLMNSEEYNWITFNPIGVVSDAEIYW